MSVDSHPNS